MNADKMIGSSSLQLLKIQSMGGWKSGTMKREVSTASIGLMIIGSMATKEVPTFRYWKFSCSPVTIYIIILSMIIRETRLTLNVFMICKLKYNTLEVQIF